jgi:hypothetical protein
MQINDNTMSIFNIVSILFFFCPGMFFAQENNPCKSPVSMNVFKVTFILDGKVKDLDTNFKVNLYNNDKLICSAQSFDMMFANSSGTNKKDDRISSLIRIPVIKLDSLSDLSAEIVSGTENIKFDANHLKYQDSLKFCDCFALYIYKFSKQRKFPKSQNRSYWNFKEEIEPPQKDDFPFVIIGWKLEEIEIELEQLK